MSYECPNDECDSNTFVQNVKKTEIVHLDDDGEPEQFEKAGEGDVKSVECRECGTELTGEE
jgi:hypothetical protein